MHRIKALVCFFLHKRNLIASTMDEAKKRLSTLGQILAEAEIDAKESLKDFANGKIFKMGRFIRVYSELLCGLDAASNEDLIDELRDADDSSILQDLNDFLAKWDAFLEDVETKTHEANEITEDKLELFSCIPESIQKNGSYFNEIQSDSYENTTLREIAAQKSHGSKYGVLVMLRHFA